MIVRSTERNGIVLGRADFLIVGVDYVTVASITDWMLRISYLFSYFIYLEAFINARYITIMTS